jgi:lipopolysaccharide assembly outer membrane protein LptD (OstA)
LKFIRLFFILLCILTVKVYSYSTIHVVKKIIYGRDTLIQLDSVKNRNLMRKPRRGVIDTAKLKKGTLAADTAKKPKQDGLQSEVKGVATDSSRVDNIHKISYLWGAARVTYDDFEMDADYIRIDQLNHLIYASGLTDPKSKRYGGRPILKQKSDKPVIADSIVFNYITKKGKIYNASSEQDGNYLSGGTVKRLNSEETALRNVEFSTCDLAKPHYGIIITKGIAETHQIISGPAYFEFEGVPLPIILPFGFFPKPDHRTSGFILPSPGEDQRLGFFLRNFGYYFAISDYVDVTTMGSYYAKGSFEANSTIRYLKRYKFQGNLALSYGSHNYGLETDPPTKDFNINWTHSQDPDAHPGTTFSAAVNAGTSSYYRNNPLQYGYNLQALTQNNLRSSIAYGKVWPNSPFNFTASLGHSQDLTLKTVTLELPTLSFNMASISPFDSKDRVGEQKWYQRITVSYSLQASNRLNAIPESELFTANTFIKRAQNGFNQQIPVSLSLNVLKYFQFNSSVNYHEVDYFQTIRKHYDRNNPLGAGIAVIDTVPGFKRGSDYSLSTGLSTKVYGTINFKKGNLKAIRHVMTPSLSFQYRPDFSDPSYGYYNTAVSNAVVPFPYTASTYSIFEQGIYGGPGAGKSAGLAISIDNTIEAKLKARASDTSGADRKIPLLQGLSVSTFYNFLADSMRLSDISFQGRTALFNQKLGINFGGTFRPYVVQVRDSIQNNQVQKYIHQTNQYTLQNGQFPTLINFSLSMDISLNSNALKHPNAPVQTAANTLATMNKAQADRLALINANPNAFVDFNVPWNVNLSYSFNYTNSYITTQASNTVNINGDVNITPKWKIQYTTGFDVRQGKVSTSSLNIYRDLHCWDLSFQWIPFGYYKFYSVDLRVKASILQDLKLSKRKDYYNNY